MRAAIYCRLSSEDRDKLSARDDSLSIRNQKAMLVRYALVQGWHIYDIYSDDDFSGADRSRPEFNRLIGDAKDRRFEIVLCKSQSRFTRELELVEKYIHGLFPRLGIRFVSPVDGADSENKGNKKARQINGLANEWFLEELSANIRSVKESQRLRGQHTGAFAPYGYRKDPEVKGHLTVDPEAAEVVRKIYKLYLDGMGKRSIARSLNEAGIPNPTAYKGRHGMVARKKQPASPLWSYFTVSNILTSEVYIGNMVQGKSGAASYKTREKVIYPKDRWTVVEGTHSPIIEREVWDLAQQRIAQRAVPGPRQPEGVFARKVRCLSCGAGMRAVKSGSRRGFRCSRHTIAPGSCIGASISLPRLERTVAAEVAALSRELLDEEALEAGISELESGKQQTEEAVQRLEREPEAGHAALRELYLRRIHGQLSEREYTELAARISREKAPLETGIPRMAQTPGIRMDRKALISRYADKRRLAGETVSYLVDRILVGPRDPVTGERPIEIHWNF